jgi:hypothetical protein
LAVENKKKKEDLTTKKLKRRTERSVEKCNVGVNHGKRRKKKRDEKKTEGVNRFFTTEYTEDTEKERYEKKKLLAMEKKKSEAKNTKD